MGHQNTSSQSDDARIKIRGWLKNIKLNSLTIRLSFSLEERLHDTHASCFLFCGWREYSENYYFSLQNYETFTKVLFRLCLFWVWWVVFLTLSAVSERSILALELPVCKSFGAGSSMLKRTVPLQGGGYLHSLRQTDCWKSGFQAQCVITESLARKVLID